MSDVRVGLDTGGTFTDVVAHDAASGVVLTDKVPSDASPEGMLAPLVGKGVRSASAVVHGTTRITNAILEGQLARVALVATRGFADVLAIARQARDNLYDLHRPARVEPIVPPELRFEVAERCGPDGSVLEPLRGEDVAALVARLEAARPDAVAVCLLHAYANPEHERRLGMALRGRWPCALSHEVSAERREYERASTTALNAAVLSRAGRYLLDLEASVERALPGSRLYVVHSAGGMSSVDAARTLPLATVMSGPAAGVSAAGRLARRRGVERAVSLDMGGTSTDVSLLVDGRVASARHRQVAGHAVRLPAVDVESIATGGGSIVWVDDVGALRVGPRSAGAIPGPACFGRGGTEPTVTDADVVSGMIAPDRSLGGVEIDPDAAARALEPVADRLGTDLFGAARAAIDVAHAQMERALRLATVQRGHDLRGCTLIAYGGAGAVHAGPLAARAGIRRVLVPQLASVFSALGCALSDVLVESVRSRLAAIEPEVVPALERELDEMVAERLHALRDQVAEGRAPVVERLAELRYRGQNDELPVAWPDSGDPQALRTRFEAVHRREYGYVTDEPLEVVALRCRITIAEELGWPAPAVSARAAAAAALPSGDPPAAVTVAAIDELTAGALDGPALIAAPLVSITVDASQRARLDEDGTVLLEAM